MYLLQLFQFTEMSKNSQRLYQLLNLLDTFGHHCDSPGENGSRNVLKFSYILAFLYFRFKYVLHICIISKNKNNYLVYKINKNHSKNKFILISVNLTATSSQYSISGSSRSK